MLFNFFRSGSKQGQLSVGDGEETSRDSETSPNCSERRIARQFDQDETEAANMLGNIYNIFHANLLIQNFYILLTNVIICI